MIGTIVNTCTIIIGSIAGAVMNRGIKEKYKDTLYTGLGLACLGIGLNAVVSNFGKSEYHVLFIVSSALGSIIGTALNLDGRFANLINKRSKSQTNTHLADGLSTAILLYCIGPLAMLGPVISALKGDNTFLYTNATLDLVTSTVFASTYGIWMILAAPVLFCWQGLFYSGKGIEHSHQRSAYGRTPHRGRTDDCSFRPISPQTQRLQDTEHATLITHTGTMVSTQKPCVINGTSVNYRRNSNENIIHAD